MGTKTARRIVAAALAAIALALVASASLSLRNSLSSLSMLGSWARQPELAPSAPASSEIAPVPNEKAEAAPVGGTETIREEIAARLDEAWACIGAGDFVCASMILSPLRAANDSSSLESAQVLYALATLEMFRGNRVEAIRALEAQMPLLADLSDDFHGRMQGMLARLYLWEQRYGEALDAVDVALQLAPQDSFVRLRETIVAQLLDPVSNRSDEFSGGRRDLILLDQVIE